MTTTRPGPGRPRLAVAVRTINLKLPAEDLTAIDTAAAATNSTRSEWLRGLIRKELQQQQ